MAVKSIAVIGEDTTRNGPYVDDYFFVFVTTPERRQFRGSFYAEGREDLLTALSRRFTVQLKCGLCHSSDLTSRCLRPPALEGKPLFPFTRGPAGGDWSRMRRFLYHPITPLILRPRWNATWPRWVREVFHRVPRRAGYRPGPSPPPRQWAAKIGHQ